jgi:RNA recognition motif-containing protein
MTCKLAQHLLACSTDDASSLSISAQVILRGTRSAGYGFVAVSSAEAAQKAVETLDKQELDGRQVIVEIAKPADQKDQEKKEKKAKRKPGRRGSKAVPGEVTEAEANGETKAEAVAPSIDEAAKPKKKKKNNVSCQSYKI